MTGMRSSVYPGSTWKKLRVEFTAFFDDIILHLPVTSEGA
jgi:hypothetical protein